MKNVYEIKSHMGAVRQTRQVTNAMYLMSASRMRRTVQHVEYNRRYFRRVRATVKDILKRTTDLQHRYLEHKSIKSTLYLVIAGDNGMCGPYNHNVLKYALEQIQCHEGGCHLITVGRMASAFFHRNGMPPDMELREIGVDPTLREARQLARTIFDMYDDDVMGEVYLIYTHYKNSLVQYPRNIKLLPLDIEAYGDVPVEYEYSADMIYEPSPKAVFDTLVPQMLIGLIFGALAQSYASEQSARMSAMERATDNADNMLSRLNNQYNTARQFAITQEISEIASAAKRLTGGNAYGTDRKDN
jgi:F-type H+-transporting ATPase subunit gamma